MTITVYDHDEIGPQVRNRWVYPPGCLPTIEDVVTRIFSFSHYSEYEPEHRPYPSDLNVSLTSRPRVYRRQGTSPLCWTEFPLNCPHSGIHGVGKLEAYHTGGSTLFENLLYDESLLRGQHLWAAPLREKITADRVNLGSSLAEYRESVSMFVKTAKGLHDAYKVLRGKVGRRKLRICSVPAAVLQYNFGVAPLVEDLFSSVEVLRLRLGQPIRRRLSAGVTKKFLGLFEYGPYTYDAVGSFKERATINYRIHPNQYLSDGFDFGNPLEWAWELIPFSFVVDWAIPIGGWLGSLDALQGTSDVHGTVTTRTADKWAYWSNITSRIGSIGSYNSISYQRDLITSVPLPPIPAWSPSLSYKRAINAVSLLAGISSTCRNGS